MLGKDHLSYERDGSFLESIESYSIQIGWRSTSGALNRSCNAQVGELDEALDAIKWGTDYLLSCHVEPKKFVAMYGNSEVRSHPHLWHVLFQ